jgi:hypothetical protein
MLKSNNIDMTRARHLGREEQGSRLRVRGRGKGSRIGKDETDAIIDETSMVSLVVLYAAANRFEEQVLVLASRRQPREEDRIEGTQELA